MSTRIVHISDTHFGTEIPAVVKALGEAVQTIRPDVVVLSGDITQRAHVGQFKAAADFMASLPAPTKLVIPGNHDIPLFNLALRFLSPYRNYSDAFGARESTWCNEDVGFVCYDATSPSRHKMGKLLSKPVLRGIAELKNSLLKGAVVIACAHQPLVTSWAEDTGEVLINRQETARLWAEHGVDIALSGHVHVPLLTTTHMTFPELPRHFILSGAGTAVSHRVRAGAPNSFNVMDITREEHGPLVEISQYNFDKASSVFQKIRDTRFRQIDQDWQPLS